MGELLMESILAYFEWLVVLASFIAVGGIVLSYKHMLSRLRENGFNEESQKKLQTKFFINVFLVELIPLVLIVMAFSAIQNYPAQNPTMALIITIFIAAFGIIMVFLERMNVDRNNIKEVKFINVYTFMMLYLITAIPLVAVVLLLIAQKSM
jgi:undecaprenyl pyrophosphate phosphatase UppP